MGGLGPLEGENMSARKPTSDEQFGVLDIDDGYEGPTTELDELFDHHGYQVYDAEDPTLDLEDDDG
jgi:hypothetical protein